LDPLTLVKECSENFLLLIYSSGNPGEYTIKELAEKIQHMVNPSVNVVYQPLPSDDPTRRRPDITRAKNSLDWEPKIPLDEGLKRTIDDFKVDSKSTVLIWLSCAVYRVELSSQRRSDR
jgi:nucleoside-diphosphate-sugar epimerase